MPWLLVILFPYNKDSENCGLHYFWFACKQPSSSPFRYHKEQTCFQRGEILPLNVQVWFLKGK